MAGNDILIRIAFQGAARADGGSVGPDAWA